MRIGAPDLDDAESLISADVEGSLHSVALAGAQVRAVAEARREGVLEPLSELQPRAVVVVTGASRTAAAAADLLVSTVAGRVDVPIVVGPVLPGWIGPLDAVVVLGEDAGDMALADAAARASRRRAELVVAAPIEGPLRDAVGGNGIDLSARLDVDPRFRFSAHVAALLAVLTSFTRVRVTGQMPDLDDLATALDAEAAANHVSGESFHNRAKLLAERLMDRPVVFAADTPGGMTVAARAAQVLLSIAGRVSGATDLMTAATLRPAAGAAGPAVDPLFHDPQIDGPLPAGHRILVVSAPRREWYIRQRVTGVDGAELILGSESITGQESGDSPGAGHIDGGPGMPVSPAELSGDLPADLPAFLLQLLRIEMAAVYLRLIEA